MSEDISQIGPEYPEGESEDYPEPEGEEYPGEEYPGDEVAQDATDENTRGLTNA
jgi:hypothetical protein